MAINRIVVSGNLGKDCETRSTPNGKLIASFSLPVKQGYGDHEKTSWIICRMFGSKAETLPQYLKKGMKVTVDGEFVMEEWTDREGGKRQAATIIVDQIELPPRQQNSQTQQGGQSSQGWGQPQQSQQSQQNEPPMDFSDDIPF